MTTSPWPLSAAATRLLVDLREDRAPSTTTKTISQLTVKELILRGHVRVLSVNKRRMRSTIVTVATAAPGSVGPLPPPLDVLARELPVTGSEELSKLIRKAAKGNSTLFSVELEKAALNELKARGLAENRVRKVLGFWPSTFVAPTAAGRELAARADADLTHAVNLRGLAEHDENAAMRAVQTLGVLILLAPAGLAVLGGLAQRWRRRGGRAAGELDLDGFDVLAACAETLGDVMDSLGDDFGSFDAAFDAVASSVDSGIDSSMSDGGGDGSSGGDGGGCGGGGD
ncbi:MAG: hypothetical protein JHD16_10205 [Solirubrobacteraceae bacterium]|nr:hypothetical protein [Solirubrobacteraceae bacterium]